jgi:uncharacterized protein YjbI with pentapeptide repeats
MKTFKPLALSVLTRPMEFGRRFFLSVAAVSFCPMGDHAALLGEVAMWKFLAKALPPETPLDMVLPKTAGEFLVSGSAFAPGGVPVQTITTSVRLGAVTKRLSAVGERHVEDGVPTQPRPFVEMPMGWDRSYGGKKYAQNPLGRGIDEAPIEGVGFRVALPNVVLPAGAPRPSSPEPVNYGPMDLGWPQRQRLAGTHDQAWLENDFPGFARDTDWRVFMAASTDQRFPGFLRGDEDYAIANMHPREPEITGRLPGVLPRVLIQRRGASGLEDIPLSLTTVWFFPTHKRLVMIHHGRTRVMEEDARDVTRLVLGADMLGAPRPIAAFQAAVDQRLDPEFGTLEALRDSALVPADLIVPDPDMEAERELNEEKGLLAQRAHQRALKQNAATRQRMVDMQLDPDVYAPPPPVAHEPVPTLENLPAVIERVRREAAERQVAADETRARMEAQSREVAIQAGMEPVDPKKRPSGPPRFSAAATMAQMQANAERIEAGGGDAGVLRGTLADPVAMKRLTDFEAAQRQGYIDGADQQDPAPRRDAAANAALRERLMDGRRNAAGADLSGADLSGLDLSGFDLTGAWLDGADLAGTNLSRARLQGAVLAHARLERAVLAGAELDGANLGRAKLAGADLAHARMRGAVLRGADLRGARFLRADLSDAMLGDASLAGADLSEVNCAGLLMLETDLSGVTAVRANFAKASFINAKLGNADFSGANLTQATFLGAAAPGIVFAEANLTKAVFVEACVMPGARFTGARCAGANLRGSNLEGAVFDRVVLDDADLSECKLQGASFDLARARMARFTVADLRGARLTRADLMGASLSRADISGADLTDSSLHEADLARIQSDTATRYERVHRSRARIHPRRSPT